jgi:predicted GIY-YIG superfamily endonuclease
MTPSSQELESPAIPGRFNWPTKTYVGQSTDLRKRLAAHNAGQSAHTARFKPWKLTTYFAFADESTAVAFERYLKSASGRAFSKRHF